MKPAFLIVAAALLVSGAAAGQELSTAAGGQAGGQGTQQPGTQAPGVKAQAQGQTPTGFGVEGNFDVGFRWRDVDGSLNKYREDINLRTGPRLFNLNLNVTSADFAFFDRLTLSAENLGGDPFESFAVGVQKFGTFRFGYRRNESEYFYRDLLFPPEEWNASLSNGGDFHTFDFRRTNDTFDFSADLARGFTTYGRFDRFIRRGESTTTLDIARDEFEFDVPLDQEKYDATLGAQYQQDSFTVSFDETYRNWDTSDGRIFLPGASPGENVTNLTELFFFERIAPYGFEMWQSTGRVNVRPTARLDITGAVTYATLDADFDFEETTRGVNFNGAPLNTLTAGGGGMDRNTTLVDLDVSYELNEMVSLMGAFRSARFDQTADVIETGTPGANTELDISSDLFEASAQVFPIPRLSLTGGVRFENRGTTLFIDEQENSPEDTERTSLFVNAAFQPMTNLQLLAEYERGDYDNPFTLISPTTLDRVKARVRYRPMPELTLVGTLLTRRIDNSLSGARIDLTDFTAAATYERQRASMSASYSRRQVDNDVVNTIFFGTTTRVFPSIYESTVDMGTLDLGYQVTDMLRPGVGFVVYNNDGSFPLEWRQYQAFLEVMPGRGYTVRIDYRHNSFDEMAWAFETYSSNIVTVSAGYRF